MKIGIIGAGLIRWRARSQADQARSQLVPKGLFRALPEATIVVDTGNYYPSFRDGPIAAIESGMTESGWVAQQLGRPVLKAFNNITAHSLAEGGLSTGVQVASRS